MLLNLLTEERQARLNLEGRFLELQKEQLATETGVTSIHHSSYVNNKTLEDQALLKTLEARFSDLKNDHDALKKADQTENNLLNTNMVFGRLESKINNSITQFEERFIQFKNRTHDDLENKLKAEEVIQNKSLSNAYSMVITQIYNLENTINFTLSRLDFVSSPVAVTACVDSGKFYSSGEVVPFTDILSVNGLSSSELSTFKSGGKFRCTKPGLYFLSTHLTTSTDNGVANLYKDNKHLSQFYFSLKGNWQTNGVVVLQNLSVNNLVYVKLAGAMEVLSGRQSCFSLFQGM
ncbi:Hypothetical predicted protein [Mytilus galloprovincialis]|uniref:C1q domain-containing protein n=1 Tax=Mytilus galloprovincialis TaxID=29158 RepID=A0A8B6HDF3_MYTGA|nr:Hypothetical predicted protein [Mytilus galloprovincialis]